MALPRYSQTDSYIIEELLHEYRDTNSVGRLRLMRRLKRVGEIPEQLIDLALADESVPVRAWIAQHAVFHSDDFRDRIKSDPDPYVRACIWENPSNFSWFSLFKNWHKAFQEAGHLERLALVRNPNVNLELIEKIADPDDQDLGIGLDKRQELICAFLTNKAGLSRGAGSYGEWAAKTGADYADIDGIKGDIRKHYARLWELAAKWPDADIEYGVRYLIYRHVGADDETKAQAYKSSSVALRRAILRNDVAPIDAELSNELLKIAAEDEDDGCRSLAHGKYSKPPESKWKGKVFSAGRTAVIKLAAIVIAYKILEAATSHFETIVFGLLVLTYVAITSDAQVNALARFEQALAAGARHLRILKLLKDPLYSEDIEEESEQNLKRESDNLKKAQIRLVVAAVFDVVLSVMALYKMVVILF